MADLPDWFSASVLKGWDGSALQTVKVDDAGRPIIVPRGESGYYLDVDSHGYLTVRARGVDAGDTQRDLLVDSSGRLMAMVKALFNTTVKDVKCDTNGNLTLNVKAQDLAEIINRPKYGGAIRSSDAVGFAAAGYTTFVTIIGKGMIYGGHIFAGAGQIKNTDSVHLYVDGEKLAEDMWSKMNEHQVTNSRSDGLYLLQYNVDAPRYTCGVMPGITFEESVVLRYYTYDANWRSVYYNIIYALI